MKHLILTAAIGFLAAGCASAQTEAAPQAQAAAKAAPQPCSTAPFRDFDFWVGDWAVFGPNGQKAGDNSISIEENGCLLLEKWTNTTGGTGQSYNFVDLGSGKWRQVWVSTGATIDYSGALNKAGAMVLEGEIGYPIGTKFPFRGTWTLLDDGDVRQHFEQYNPETEEWADWFIGLYKKNEAP